MTTPLGVVRVSVWLTIWLVSMAAGALETAGCAGLAAAHEALLAGSFSVERSFSLKMNGELKASEVTRLTWRKGDLTREVLERKVLDRNIVMDEGEGEASLIIPFGCERVREVEANLYELVSEDGLDHAVFFLSRDRGAFEPVSWWNNETVRFLWKKMVIEAAAEYRDFVWQ